jgi:hypothetical protein
MCVCFSLNLAFHRLITHLIFLNLSFFIPVNKTYIFIYLEKLQKIKPKNLPLVKKKKNLKVKTCNF